VAKIRIAIAGVGNCASSLVQGLEYYRNLQSKNFAGLMHPLIGSWGATDVEVVSAFDIDRRKVGQPLETAIFAKPNCTTVFQSVLPVSNVTVQMGPVLDGVAGHMENYDDDNAFRVSDADPVDIAAVLRESDAEVLVCYLPVGSEQAVRHYAEACLEAKVAMVNCVPVFLASDPAWANRFSEAGIPIVGDDIKSQLGATIVHRTLSRLFDDRGMDVKRTYQLNTGGNTDFLNMLEYTRLKSKKKSKTESVQSQFESRLKDSDIHIGPSDYVPWQNDNKIAFIRLEGLGFGDVPMNLELRLSVEDSPNSAGVVIDAVRCAKLGLERGIGGPLEAPSSYYMKSPPVQIRDSQARELNDGYICGGPANIPEQLKRITVAAADRDESTGAVRSALILAAGTGSRLFPETTLPKPLTPVRGLTLAERVVRTLCDGASIERFVIALGYEAETVKSHFQSIGHRLGVNMEFVSAPDHVKGNGASALGALEAMGDEPFILSMCDHLYEPKLAQDLVENSLAVGTMTLAIDTNKSAIFDIDDVMKVSSQNGKISSISKSLENWDCADTGVMYCTSALFEGLSEAAAAGKHGLADGVRVLAERGMANVKDVTGTWWLDIDTTEALEIAENYLVDLKIKLTG
jgi:myo-inositol-1-phosphate synthase